jgi:hypothetical protein
VNISSIQLEAAVTLALILGLLLVFYWWRGRIEDSRRRRLRQTYQTIYRVLRPPSAGQSVLAEGAKITVGDLGWEAEPLSEDGLIYLQGLTAKWRVVWHAGFKPEELERVAFKPTSQYDWNYRWLRNPPQCPFPVEHKESSDLGLPGSKALGQIPKTRGNSK